MDKNNNSGDIKYVDITLIDAPERAMRSEINDEQFNELVSSISENGILQALVVRPKNGRYEIIAGHRRFKAAWHCQLSQVPVMVRDTDDRQATVLKVHENMVRQDINVVDEAKFVAESINELGIGTDEFARMIGRSEGYVQDRLQVATMSDYMLVALQAGTLKLGVALALNELPDDKIKEEYTKAAIADGCTLTAAKYWVKEYRRLYVHHEATGGEPATFSVPTAPPKVLFQCVKCGAHDEPDRLMFVRIHNPDCPPSPTE